MRRSFLPAVWLWLKAWWPLTLAVSFAVVMLLDLVAPTHGKEPVEVTRAAAVTGRTRAPATASTDLPVANPASQVGWVRLKTPPDPAASFTVSRRVEPGEQPFRVQVRADYLGAAELPLAFGKYVAVLDSSPTADGVEFEVSSATMQEHVLTPRLAELRGQILDSKGQPIAKAEIQVSGTHRGMTSMTTDESGRFGIKVVSGIYSLMVKAAGYLQGRIHGLQVAPELGRNETIVLDPLDSSLAVTLMCDDQPCMGGEVTVELGEETRRALAWRGVARLKDLPPGELEVSAIINRGLPEERRGTAVVKLSSARVTQLNLTLDAAQTEASLTPTAAVPADELSSPAPSVR